MIIRLETWCGLTSRVHATPIASTLCDPSIQVRIVIILNDGRDGRSTSATNPTCKSKVPAASTMRAEGDSQ